MPICLLLFHTISPSKRGNMKYSLVTGRYSLMPIPLGTFSLSPIHIKFSYIAVVFTVFDLQQTTEFAWHARAWKEFGTGLVKKY